VREVLGKQRTVVNKVLLGGVDTPPPPLRGSKF